MDAVGKLGDKMQKIMEHDLEAKAAGLMQSIDFQQVLTGEGGDSNSSRNGDDGIEISVDTRTNGATTPQKPRKKGRGGSGTKKISPTAG